MESFVNNKILEKVDDIVSTIKDSKEYQDYQFLFSKLSQNEKVNDLIKEVKDLQKRIVKKEVLQESTIDLEKQVNSLLEQLNQIPLYVEFIQKQEELDQIYQNIKDKLEQYFYMVLN